MTQKKEKKDTRPAPQNICLNKHIHFDQIDSTNTWAKQHPEEWDPNGVTLITASEQIAGRGRFNRQWVSPSNLNIYATFCFWINIERTDIGHIPQILALAAAQTLEEQGFYPTIKWPNDLLLNNKKIGGILCETIIEKGKRGIVCGIGLNVNMPLEILAKIDRPATSLMIEGGNVYEIEVILKLLHDNFLVKLNTFLHQGFSPFFPVLQEKSALKRGEFVRFHDNQILLEAQFEQLHPDGSVELRLSDGTLKIVHAGEFVANDSFYLANGVSKEV